MKVPNLLLAILLFSCTQEPKTEWQEAFPGIWTYQIGAEDPFNLLKAAKAKPQTQALQTFSEQAFPLAKDKVIFTRQKGKLYLRFPLEKDEEIYGLGLQFKQVNRRGKNYHLQVDHYGGKDNGRTHAPVPFYVSSKGYGVLINSARYISVYVGSANRVDSENPPTVFDRNTDKNWSAQHKSDVVEILIPDDKAEVILFGGKSPMEAVQKYNLYAGGGVLPPKWGLGFTYRTHTKYSDEQVLKEVEAFEEQGFPLDFIGLEPGWMNRSYPCSYEWDAGRFPKPRDFVQTLLKKGVRSNLWMNPYIAPKAQLYESMLPYAGSHTVWNGIVPDYTLEAPRKIFSDFYLKNQLDIGVSGLKIDEVDGYDNWIWPDVASFPSGLDAEHMRQIYGLLMQEMVGELYHKKNVRTYGLTRASNAGASYLPFVLYNDYYKHEDFITALVNSGFSGLLWTPEVRNSPTGEEWLRRMQAVCFSPMAMINAWSSGTKPWSYPEVYEEVKAVALLRMQLLPYIYSTFAAYQQKGIPPIRPMPLLEDFRKEGSDDTEYAKATRRDIKDQYLFGENILVAPVFAGQESRKVILPKGKWFDFYSGAYMGAEEIIEVKAELDKIPLFVKNGGLIPMISPRLHAPRKDEVLALEVRHYGDAAGDFQLYDDDGESFAYENGEFSWTLLSVDKAGQVKMERRVGEVFNYKDIQWKFMSKNRKMLE